MNLSNTQQMDLDLAASGIASVAALGCLNAAKCHLFQNNIVVNRFTTLAALAAAEATFAGYAAAAITWGAPSVADTGEVEVVGTVPQFRPTNAVTPNSIWGLYVTDSANAKLYFAGTFDAAPLAMGDNLHTITVTIRWKPATFAVVVTVS